MLEKFEKSEISTLDFLGTVFLATFFAEDFFAAALFEGAFLTVVFLADFFTTFDALLDDLVFTGTFFDFYYYEDSIYVSHYSYKRGIKEGIYTGYLEQYDEDLKSREKYIRSIREEGTCENGVREGSFSWEFEFGKDKGDRREGTYVNDVREGPYVYYFSDGSREEGTYINNVIDGPFVYYSSDTGEFKGHRLEGTYINNVKDGPFVYYYDDGSSRKGTYTNGKREFNN